MKATIDKDPGLKMRAVGKRLRRARAESKRQAASKVANGVSRTALREERLDRIAAGKTKLWHGQLRLTQLVTALILCLAVSFVIWKEWAFWATTVSSLFTVAGMWAFARWMTPREQRLRRHMVCLSRRRRSCVSCGYRLCDLQNARCPECGTAFDPNDTRHLLRAETLRTYSSRARAISALAIVYVVFWVTTIVHGYSWPASVALAMALLLAFHLLHWGWIRQSHRRHKRDQAGLTHENDSQTVPQAEAKEAEIDRANRDHTHGNDFGHSDLTEPRCPGCGVLLYRLGDPVPGNCPSCRRSLTYGDVFVRPDIRRLWDPRVTSLQYQSLLLRWAFLVLTCGGLTTLVNLDVGSLRILSFGMGPSMLVVMLGVPLLVWVIGLTLALRFFTQRLHRRLRLLFAQIHPTCRRCDANLSSLLVGEPCPNCGRCV